MIIVKIDGGLGNQMFQYALGEALRSKGKNVKYDIREVKKNIHNGFELTNAFENIRDFPIALNDECGLLGVKKVGRLRNLLRRYYHTEKYIEYISPQSSIKYYASIFDYDDAYLVGYWQSYKYFEPIRDMIRNSFYFADIGMDKICKNMMDKIANDKHSVSMHVRRGDYVGNKLYDDICDFNYYLRAIEYMKKIDKDTVFYVFSNDLEWCRNTLLKDVVTSKFIYVKCNMKNMSYRDMQLMSLCRRNIIANSTFSWWSAWLNTNEDKVVVTPSKWFNKSCICIDDLIPNGWIRL
ncbi:MAG: alpha-1,2-fucosyltransferase [Butyrivibrio sp.]|nr:alpha-1,2-fucosyltransferase [Butyrivibrio sp.]